MDRLRRTLSAHGYYAIPIGVLIVEFCLLIAMNVGGWDKRWALLFLGGALLVIWGNGLYWRRSRATAGHSGRTSEPSV